MHTLTEEHARRAVQLRNDYALCTVDDERTVGCHVRDSAKENVLYECAEVFVVGIRTVEFHLSLQRYAICKTALKALVN